MFDPPYRSGGATSHKSMVGKYGLDTIQSDTKSGHGNAAAVWQFYLDGMTEAHRILTDGGLMWVKCQDFVESGKQFWFHVEIYNLAVDLGMKVKDLFTLTQHGSPMMRHKSQHHARRNNSYLWVFEKTSKG